jgi:hypothetical protein
MRQSEYYEKVGDGIKGEEAERSYRKDTNVSYGGGL